MPLLQKDGILGLDCITKNNKIKTFANIATTSYENKKTKYK